MYCMFCSFSFDEPVEKMGGTCIVLWPCPPVPLSTVA